MEKNDGNGSAEEGAGALAETQDSKKAGTVCDEIMPNRPAGGGARSRAVLRQGRDCDLRGANSGKTFL
jgi:hypothetical protein